MRVVALHPDVLVVTSRMWQTNAVLLRAERAEREPPATEATAASVGPGLGPSGELPMAAPAGGTSGAGDAGASAHEAMLVDSPYFPDELEALPALGQGSGFAVEALLATHADFDHLLGRLAFPKLALGVGASTADRLRAEPGAAQRELRDADEGHYVVREAPLRLGAGQELPLPGRLELGREELELQPADGHTPDGMAVFAAHVGVLLSGDYLSDVEIPVLSPGGTLATYRATLARLAPLVERAERIVPGHGSPLTRELALEVLDDDVDYLDALERGEERPRLALGRDSARQRAVHAENLRRVESRE